ncbi:MAG: PAS domain S-box protein [bacterium]|nr:PAS domain S-box protein [bacterium]
MISQSPPWPRYIALAGGWLLILAGLYMMNQQNSLLAHSLVEMFGVVVAGGVFMTGWNSRQFQDNNYFPFLGLGYLFVGLMEMIHLLSHPGLGVLAADKWSPNLAIELQIATRLIESVSLLIAPWFIGRKLKVGYIFSGYLLATALGLSLSFSRRFLPVYFFEGRGTTALGKGSEIVICLILFASIIYLIRKRREFDPQVVRLLFISIMMTIGSELTATFAISMDSHSMLTAHFLKLFSFYLIYKAIVEIGMMKPYQLLFRNLKQSEELFRESSNRCEVSLGQSKRELTIRNQISDIFLTVPDDRMYSQVLDIILKALDSQYGFFGYVNQVGEIAVANKATDYTDKDQELLEVIVNSKLAPILYARLESETREQERQKAEESLRAAYAELDQIFDTAADGMWVVDKNFTVIRVNNTLSVMAGFDQDKIVGEKCYRIFPGATCHTTSCPMVRILQGEDRVEYDVVKHTLDGREIFCLANITPFLAPDGELIGIVEDFKDIGERKRMEEELRRAKEEEEAKYLRLVEQANDGVVIIQDEKLVFVNRAMTEIVGYTVEEMIGQPHWKFLAPECRDLIIERCRLRLAGQPVPSFYETKFQAKDGVIKEVEISAGVIQYQAKAAILGIIRDISIRKRMEEELLKVQKLESIGLLAGGIAHDFNNLLAAIIGNLSLIEMYLKSGSGSIIETLKNTEIASQQARELTQQLLTFSKGGSPVRKSASVANLLRDAARLSLSGSNITCRLYLPDDLWWAEIDEGQINQVINNLLINADQAMPGGGIIELRAENVVVRESDNLPLKGGEYIRVSVKDRGIGIPKEYLPHIFDPYFTTKQKGSGLGLAISYSIIKKHGGYITVDSKVGTGTIFSFYLPASSRQALAVEDVIEEEGVICGQGKILFMDDQEIIRNMAEEMLTDLGYEVELARDGYEVVEMYKKAHESGNDFDAVILDLTVPGGIGGSDVIGELLKIDPEVRAIVSSGYSADPIMSEYERYGFKGVVAKPYKLEDLSRELHRVLKGSRGDRGDHGPKPPIEFANCCAASSGEEEK